MVEGGQSISKSDNEQPERRGGDRDAGREEDREEAQVQLRVPEGKAPRDAPPAADAADAASKRMCVQGDTCGENC